MRRKQINTYQLALYILGIYLIFDGLGSIVIYQRQPWSPDHMMRIIRMIVGVGIIFISKKISAPVK
jgi:hypothetical protein